MFRFAKRNVPFGCQIIEFSFAPLAGPSVVDFITRANILIQSTFGPRFAKCNWLACCHHQMAKLVRLGLPLRYWSSGLGFLNLTIEFSTSSRKLYLLAVNNSLISSIEYLALLTKDFPANIFMPAQCFFIERPAAVIALNETLTIWIGIRA